MLFNPSQIHIDDFSYDLPENRIALYPLENRDGSKLLVYESSPQSTVYSLQSTVHSLLNSDQQIQESTFSNLTDYLPADSFLIFNKTKVIQARLLFQKEGKEGSVIEIFCLNPVFPYTEMNLAFQQKGSCQWNCLIGNAKRWKSGILTKQIIYNNQKVKLYAEKVKPSSEGHIIEFSWEPEILTFSEILDIAGQTPLPPYIKRNPEESDKTTYQTVYAKEEGSVASPTAGLHFTENVFEKLKKNNIQTDYLTLHVGTGTFKPVTSQTIEGHKMHNEIFTIEKKTLINIINNLDKAIIPVGTTSLRTIESLYWAGVKMIVHKYDHVPETQQWDAYRKIFNIDISALDALSALLNHMEKYKIEVIVSSTSLIIIPGYKFSIIKGLVTNFHQPKSTLLLLIAALIGNYWKKVYNYALENDFRFLSYGDCCLFKLI